MPISIETMLAALSPSEKLTAMNILWQDLSKNPAGFVSPAWRGDVLAARIANPPSELPLPIDAAIDDVKERLHERRNGMRPGTILSTAQCSTATNRQVWMNTSWIACEPT
jgi:hypothetical protein